MTKKQKKMLVRIVLTTVMLIALKFIPITGIPQLAAYLVAYFVIGYDILKKAGKGILNGRAFDENFLMALATLGAFFLAVWTKSGDYVEGIAVMLFYQIGELFQSYAVGKSRRNITALMDIRPDYANIEQNGQLTQVDPDEVAVGSIIVVQPGEKVPLDGVIVEGSASLNTSALTGESLPRDVKEGDEIISGCIDLSGVLKIRTTKAFGESTVSKILDLVENASSRKSRSEAFISRFAKIYTPAVCAAALLECICNLTANEMFDDRGGCTDPYERVLEGVERLRAQSDTLIVITNDVGSDTGGYSPETQAYIAALGRINAELARRADTVCELVCGIPIVLKGALPE